MGQARRKLRRVGKWVGLALVGLVLTIHVASAWYVLRVDTYHNTFLLGWGVLRHVHSEAVEPRWPGTIGLSRHWNMHSWWFDHEDMPSIKWAVTDVPLWFLGVLLSVPSGLLWWMDRCRENCSHCDHDLTGMAADAACPRCGEEGRTRTVKPTRRELRRIGKWVAAAVVGGIAFAAVASVWVTPSHWSDQWGVLIENGRLCVRWVFPPTRYEYRLAPRVQWHDARIRWWFEANFGIDAGAVYVPLWSVLIVCGLPTVWLWNVDRRRPDCCPECGYDLTGLAPGKCCPECGKTSAIVNFGPAVEDA